MTEQYTQTLEVPTSTKDKAKLIVGIALMMLSLVFLVVGILKIRWLLICFGVLLVIGFVLVQFFESAASEYMYSISPKSFAISKKNNAHNTKRLVQIDIEKIVRIERFLDFIAPKDIIACENSGAKNVYAVVFEQEIKYDDQTVVKCRRALISPDDYMLALFEDNLGEKYLKEAEN
ncbi:MAG: hypothetical protein J5815_00665 [Clostridia bacterium]|nr:hypothetical protein [Clostridia bacterium]